MTLPAPLTPLTSYRCFVNYTLEDDPDRPGKKIKRPVDVRTGLWCAVNKPEHHYTYAEAAATGCLVGFVFNEADGFWFLDIDNCLEQTPGGAAWSGLATGLCQRLAGAAIEVSQSGKGLHIIGRGACPAHSCRNVALGLELYTHDRFVALTGLQAQGDASLDLTAAISAVAAEFFPPNPHGEISGWTDQPVPEWSGPTDDEALIRIALASGKKTAAAALGEGHITFEDLWTANADKLARKWPSDKGGYDASQADAALASHLGFWTGKNHERIRTLMLQSQLARGKWEDRPEWLETTIVKASSVVTNVFGKRVARHVPATEEDRRRQQREFTRQIGEGSNAVPCTTMFSLEEMLDRFVFIKDGSQVADRLRPQVVLPLNEFKNSTAASQHLVLKPDGTTKFVPCATVWLKHKDRLDAETLTFRAGASVMTVSPAHGKLALNLWSPAAREEVPPDWQERAGLFVNHIRWLWGDDADAFFDWLAHIEQRPGELPHFGWVHISRIHGKGRNWVSAVLARIWSGNVAASFDLLGALEGKFNDRLSRCLLAIVDEINEGGGSSWRHAQSLRQMVTAEHREINPKYGRRHVEFNSTRWLLFSNHTGALPLGADDRRFWVVDHDGPVRDANYYKELYGKLNDPLFVSSVARFLVERDVSGFDAGMRPPDTKAKTALVALAQSESEATLGELVQRWPVDLIAWSDLRRILQDCDSSYAALRHALGRAGMQKVRKVRIKGSPESIYSLRNHASWAGCSAQQLQAEVGRVGYDDKETALFGE